MSRRRSHRAALVVASLAAAAAWTAAPARAAEPAADPGPGIDPADVPMDTPAQMQGVVITEKLGATVPTGDVFTDDLGREVTLDDYLGGDLPVVLTFNYSDCPMLCSLQLNALVDTLNELKMTPGTQFQIVTIALDPLETPETVSERKAQYLQRYDEDRREAAADAWHFLVGDEDAIDALADAVGYGYRYLPRRKEYAHPAALTFLSPDGVVTRYVQGIDYPATQLSRSIIDAGMSKQGDTVGFLMACLHYDPKEGSYAEAGESVMRYGAIGFVVLLLAAFGIWLYLRQQHQQPGHEERTR